MIEVNLLSSKKDKGLSALGGLNLNLINIRMVIVAVLILYVPEGFIVDYFDSELKSVEDVNTQLRNELKKVNRKVKDLKTIENQVQALKDQESKLKRKLEVVKEIINKRQNPFSVLYYVAQNTPNELWLTDMKITDKKIEMNGYSKNWKSIGKFLEGLRNSIFFDKDIKYEQPAGGKDKNNKVEGFKISANIVRFE